MKLEPQVFFYAWALISIIETLAFCSAHRLRLCALMINFELIQIDKLIRLGGPSFPWVYKLPGVRGEKKDCRQHIKKQNICPLFALVKLAPLCINCSTYILNLYNRNRSFKPVMFIYKINIQFWKLFTAYSLILHIRFDWQAHWFDQWEFCVVTHVLFHD